MGTADIIPGISGGTIALIVGIYERLIEAVRAVTTLPISLLKSRFSGWRSAFGAIEWGFILPLGLGVGSAIILGALFIPHILDTYPVESRAFFFGLVAASLYIPWRRVDRVSASHYLMALVAAVIAFFLVGLPAAATADPSLFRVFLTAAVAICAMILPGVSGAFLLTVFGIYQPTLEALRSLDLVYVVVFSLGAITGLGLFARLLSHLLRHYHDATMILLVGLLAGSLRALWPWQGEALLHGELVATPALLQAPPSAAAAVVIFVIALAGFAIVAFLTWLGTRESRV